jgi:hypothetical protein
MTPAAIALALILTTSTLANAADAPCPGTVDLPVEFAGRLEPAEDDTLLKASLGAPNAGSLCQGKVYEVVPDDAEVTIYRAWNSTNPNSRLGKWWSFTRPNGKVAQYRTDYEICYQWSPLDKLTQCKLKPGTKLVVGTGQSATCSQYQSYPASAAKQIYLDSQLAVHDCKDYDLDFSWERVDK